MLSVTFLGTGPGDGAPDRFSSSALLRAGESRTLIDAGEPCAQRLLNIGVEPADLDDIFLTHAHADHVGGVPLLVQIAWLAGRKEPLRIFLPGVLASPLSAWLEALGLSEKTTGMPIEMIVLRDGVAADCSAGRCTPRLTTHFPKNDERPNDEAFSLDFTIPDGRHLVFSGDLGAAADLLPALGSPVALLSCELAHFGPGDLEASLRGRKIETLCLVHVESKLWEGRSQLQGDLDEALPDVGEVYVPDDGESIDI